MAARAPAARAAFSVPPNSGRRDSAAAVRSLTRRGPASRAGPVRSASSSSVGAAPLVGEGDHPVVAGPRALQRRHVVAAPRSQGDAAGEAGGHVGAQGAPDPLQSVRPQAEPPQLVACDQGGGGVGGPPGHPAGDGDPLVHADGQARGGGRPRPGGREALHGPRGAHRQVGPGRHGPHEFGGGAVDAPSWQVGDGLDGGARGPRGAHGDCLPQVEGLEDGGEGVVAVRGGGPGAQHEVDLPGGGGGDFTHWRTPPSWGRGARRRRPRREGG